MGKVDIDLPSQVEVHEIYVGGQKRDTLLYTSSIEADVNLLGLFQKQLVVQNVQLTGVVAHVRRTLPDSSFNFGYILDSFATDTPAQQQVQQQPTDTAGGGFTFKILGVELKEIYATYYDEVTGMDALLRLGFFNTELSEFDLDKEVVTVELVELAETNGRLTIFKETPPAPEEADTSAFTWNVGLNKLAVEEVDFTFKNLVEPMEMVYEIGHLQADVKELDLANQRYVVKTLSLDSSYGLVSSGAVPTADSLNTEAALPDPAQTDTTSEEGPPIIVEAEKLVLNNNEFHFHNMAEAPALAGIDWNHLQLFNISASILDIYYAGLVIEGDIESMSVRDASGFEINQLDAEVAMDSTSAGIADLDLKMPGTHVQASMGLEYESLETIGDQLADLFVFAHFDTSTISLEDVAYFVPDLSSQLPGNMATAEQVVLQGTVIGEVGNLTIDSLMVRTGEGTKLLVDGRVIGLPDVKTAYYNVEVKSLVTSRQDVQALAGPYIPQTITLPQQMRLTADVEGTLQDMTAQLRLNSSLGNLYAALETMPDAYGEAEMAYEGIVQFENLNLGTLLQQDTLLGEFTGEVELAGAGISPETIEANLTATLQEAVVNQYEYNDFYLRGSVDEMRFSGVAEMNDSNLAFEFVGEVDANDSVPSFDGKLAVEGADLHAMNFSQQDIALQGALIADIEGGSINDLQGKMGIRDVMVIKNGERYVVDSFLFMKVIDKDQTRVSINSTFMDGYFEGTINMADLPTQISQQLGRYFGALDTTVTEELAPQDFAFELNINNPLIVTEVLFPKIQELDPGFVKGSFHSRTNKLEVEAQVPHLKYNDIIVDSVEVLIEGGDQQLDYSVAVEEVSNPTIQVDNIRLYGKVAQDTVLSILRLTEEDSFRNLVLGAKMFQQPDSSLRLTLLDRYVVFAGTQWTVPPTNYLDFGGDGLRAHDFRVSNGQKLLALQSVGQADDEPLEMRFENFNLSLLSQMVERDTQLVRGVLNGTVNLYPDTAGGGAFTADVLIRNLAYMAHEIGDVKVKADNLTDDRFSVEAEISGSGNQLTADGYYQSTPGANQLNLNANIEHLDLSTIEGFFAGQLQDVQGMMEGELHVNGTTESPELRGALHLKDVEAVAEYLGTGFRIPNETIEFTEKGLHLNSFRILDGESNSALLDGWVYTDNYTNIDGYRFDLSLNTNQFEMLNHEPPKLIGPSDRLFWGTFYLTSSAQVTGTVDRPNISLEATVAPNTSFTLALPQSTPAEVDAKGIVRFVNRTGSVEPLVVEQEEQKQDTVSAGIKGMNLNAVIHLNPQADIKILTDQAAGNFFRMSGKGTLNFGIDPAGTTSLTGRLEIVEGVYKLVYYNFVRREFQIKEGSNIYWTGDPLEAQLNVTAYNEVRASPANLVTAAESGVDQGQLQRPVWFQVVMHMDGELMDPNLDFDIMLDPEDRGVLGGAIQGKLARLNEPANESELNKQVFALLVLRRFIQEDPLANEAPVTAEGVARNTVAKLLTEQLNKLSDQYLNEVQLTFDVQSYQAYEAQNVAGETDLQVGLKRRFLNDRLEVAVGGTVDIEGRGSDENNFSEIAGDVSAEYLLTPNGRWRLRAFRETEYEGLLQGDIMETGGAIIFNREFKYFRNLFEGKSDPE